MSRTKVLSEQITVNTTESSIFDLPVVRVYAAANSLVEIRDTANNLVGSFTMPGGRVEIIEKERTDVLSANADIFCTGIAYLP